MWTSKLAKQLVKQLNKYWKIPSSTKGTRERIMKAALLKHLEGVPDLRDAVLAEYEIYGSTHPFGGLIKKLITGERCVMCRKHALGYVQTKLCGLCARSPEGKQLARELNTEKVRKYWDENYESAMKKQIETSRKRFGTDFPWQSKKVQKKKKAQSLERTGLAHHFHNPAIRLKQQKSAWRIKEVRIGDRVVYCQGYEPFVLKAAAKKYGDEDILGQFEQGFEPLPFDPPYSPDFYVKSRDLYVEVKSSWTLFYAYEKNRNLAEMAADEEINLRWVVVYPTRKRIVTLDKDWWKWSRKKVEQFLKSAVEGDRP